MSPVYRGRVQISPGFCLLTAWFCAVNGWRLLAVVLGAAAAHELGHWLALRLLGASVLGLRVGIFGAVMEIDTRQLSYGGELFSVLAGPGANLLCALGLIALGRDMEVAAGAHLVLGVFNLLPVRPLDGGRALYLLIAWGFDPTAGEQAARWSGTLTAVALAAGLCFVMVRSGGSLWLLPAAVGLLTAAWGEWRGKGSF